MEENKKLLLTMFLGNFAESIRFSGAWLLGMTPFIFFVFKIKTLFDIILIFICAIFLISLGSAIPVLMKNEEQ